MGWTPFTLPVLKRGTEPRSEGHKIQKKPGRVDERTVDYSPTEAGEPMTGDIEIASGPPVIEPSVRPRRKPAKRPPDIRGSQ